MTERKDCEVGGTLANIMQLPPGDSSFGIDPALRGRTELGQGYMHVFLLHVSSPSPSMFSQRA